VHKFLLIMHLSISNALHPVGLLWSPVKSFIFLCPVGNLGG
jgi:hypothetical protein